MPEAHPISDPTAFVTVEVVPSTEQVAIEAAAPPIVTIVTEGTPGPAGREVELQVTGTHLQWRYVGAPSWNDLLPLAAITGVDGREVELQTTLTHIQWRYADGAWWDLIALADLSGADGREVELQTTQTHVQWRYVGAAWLDLIPLATLQGPQGEPGVHYGADAPADTSVLWVDPTTDDEDDAVRFSATQVGDWVRVLSVTPPLLESAPPPSGGGDTVLVASVIGGLTPATLEGEALIVGGNGPGGL